MKLSVIIVSRSARSSLDSVLTGYALQTSRDFDVTVASPADGAAPDLVAGRTRGFPVPLRHVVAAGDPGDDALYTKAIRAARGDYLLFTTGDCIPRPDLVAVHARLATPGRFLRGGSCRLGPGVSRRICRNDIVLGRCFRLDWLQAQEPLSASSRRKLEAGPVIGRLLDAVRPASVRFDPRNGSAWKADLVDGDGGPGQRLQARGVRGRNVRHKAVCLQLGFGLRGSPPAEDCPAGRDDARGEDLAWTRYG